MRPMSSGAKLLYSLVILFLITAAMPMPILAQAEGAATPAIMAGDCVPEGQSAAGAGAVATPDDADEVSVVVREQRLLEQPLVDITDTPTGHHMVVSVVCIPADTAPVRLVQRIPVSITVLTGTLKVAVTAACVADFHASPCSAPVAEQSVAEVYRFTDPTVAEIIGADAVTVNPGDVLVLGTVTYALSTGAGDAVRVLAAGVIDDLGGGGCPCARFP